MSSNDLLEQCFAGEDLTDEESDTMQNDPCEEDVSGSTPGYCDVLNMEDLVASLREHYGDVSGTTELEAGHASAGGVVNKRMRMETPRTSALDRPEEDLEERDRKYAELDVQAKLYSARETSKKNMRRAEQQIEKSKLEPEVFSSFDLALAISGKDTGLEEPTYRTWDSNLSTMGVDRNGLLITCHQTVFMDKYDTAYVTKVFKAYAPMVLLKVGGGADGRGRNKKGSYVTRPGEVEGAVVLANRWAGIGHPHEEGKPSTDWIKSSRQFVANASLLQTLYHMSLKVNASLKALDPGFFEATSQCKEYRDQTACGKMFAEIDPLVMEGRAIMFNRMTPLHEDKMDPKAGWEFLLALGDFTKGGEFRIPRLKLRMRYLPGDGLWVRGSVLEHEVEAWEGGQRISIVHFTHKTTFEEAKVNIPHPQKAKRKAEKAPEDAAELVDHLRSALV